MPVITFDGGKLSKEQKAALVQQFTEAANAVTGIRREAFTIIIRENERENIGVGGKLDALEVFHPDRMASRILGMGDILSLIEKAQEAIDAKKAQELEKKLLKDTFTLEDFREQLQQMKKMGSIDQILSMIPGMNRLKLPKDLQGSEKELVKVEAIINSMTKEERRSPEILNGSRRLRIAKGSGTTVQDVNQLLKQYLQMKKMLRQFRKGGMKGLAKGLFS